MSNQTPTFQDGEIVGVIGPDGQVVAGLVGRIVGREAETPGDVRLLVEFRDERGIPYTTLYHPMSLIAVAPRSKPRRRIWPWVLLGSVAAFGMICGIIGSAGGAESPSAGSGASQTAESLPTPFTVPESTPSASPSVKSAPAPDDRSAIFDTTVENGGIPAAAVPAAENVAHTFCDALDSGLSFDSTARLYLSQAQDKGVTPEQLGVVIGAGVPAYCPAYESDLEAFAAAN